MNLATRIACIIGNLVTAAACILGMLTYYEGIPLLRDSWLLRQVPVLGTIAGGAVRRRIDGALVGYVARSEKIAADARAAEAERQRQAATLALEESRKRMLAAQTLKDKAHADLEKRIAADSDGGCTWGADDDEFVRHH